MWFAYRRPNPGGETVPKVKHSRSAKNCDCFKDSQDKNLERNYMLSFLTKTLPQQKELKRNSKKKNNKKRKEGTDNERKSVKLKKINESNKSEGLKKTSSIVLKRNGIIPLNDGSGSYVLVSQTTTIKETPCLKENNNTTSKQSSQNKKVSNLFKFISTVKRKTHAFLLKRKCEKHVKKLEKNEIKRLNPTQNDIVDESDHPSYDIVEETFQEEDTPEECVLNESLESGRQSVCSSGYFTPVGESPGAFRKSPQLSEEVFQNVDEGSSVDSESTALGVPVETIEQTLDATGTVDREELRRRAHAGEPLYPNCDTSIWMRSCQQEVVEPIRGTVSGNWKTSHLNK